MNTRPGLPQWLALRRAGLGSTNFALLLQRFGSIEAAWDARLEEAREAGLDAQYLRAFEKARATFDADREVSAVLACGAHVVTWLDDDYPALLRDIPQSPPVLFWRGSAGPEYEHAVAIVGTRKVTPYGRQATEQFAAALAAAGVAIVSGLAHGVDTIAHRVAVDAGSPTVAVLAGGIDKIYPRENEGLAGRIADVGCLVSEYPPGIPSRPDYFPRRNRILSGLARATLVTEAGEGSGALHTANWAIEQHRDVFAVPGSVFSSQSAGTNQLIREHTAQLVATPAQLLEELNLSAARPSARARATSQPQLLEERARDLPPASGEEATILALLDEPGLHVDEVARATAMPVSAVSATLTIMDLKGLVRQARPMVYVRA